ncbi:TPA: hypothetical protein ACGO6G_002094 [Streptococcus suis]|nr:hypothetical protein [Streptococcus suis]
MTENMHIARLVFELDDLNDEVGKVADERGLQELFKLSVKIKDMITDLSKEVVAVDIVPLIFRLEDLIIELEKIVGENRIQELSDVLEEIRNVIFNFFKMFGVDAKWLHA